MTLLFFQNLVFNCIMSNNNWHSIVIFCFLTEIREDKPSAPEFIKIPEKVVARQHETAQFMVKVIGTPKPKGK